MDSLLASVCVHENDHTLILLQTTLKLIKSLESWPGLCIFFPHPCLNIKIVSWRDTLKWLLLHLEIHLYSFIQFLVLRARSKQLLQPNMFRPDERDSKRDVDCPCRRGQLPLYFQDYEVTYPITHHILLMSRPAILCPLMFSKASVAWERKMANCDTRCHA